jgi:RNA polymerase sigma factor (sigma-70 family)
MILTDYTEGSGKARTTREATIVQYIGHVHVLAKRLQLRVPPCVTYDDLVGAGTIGLIQAVDRFQPSRGLKFGTYARQRIRGAMLDFLREEDPLSRTERRRIRSAEAINAGMGEKTVFATITLEWLSAKELRKVCARAECPSSQLVDRADLRRAGMSSQRERIA